MSDKALGQRGNETEEERKRKTTQMWKNVNI